MTASKAYLIVEGHGEVAAAGNLISRVSADLGLDLVWTTPIRWTALQTQRAVERAARYVADRGDASALLVLRDEDDGCPRDLGPKTADTLRRLDLQFPAAAVLLCPEYEVLFLPCIPLMAGAPLRDGSGLDRPGLKAGANWTGPWERKRGVKEWLSKHFDGGRSYKPTLDQLPLTRMIDLGLLRSADVPCFGTLERAIAFLGSANAAGVYPPAPSGG
jgi:hypothetical protein